MEYSSVTEERHAVDARPKRAQPPGCLPDGCIETEQHYACGRQLVKTMAQYVRVVGRTEKCAHVGGRRAVIINVIIRTVYFCILKEDVLGFVELVPPIWRNF